MVIKVIFSSFTKRRIVDPCMMLYKVIVYRIADCLIVTGVDSILPFLASVVQYLVLAICSTAIWGRSKTAINQNGQKPDKTAILQLGLTFLPCELC